MSSPTRIQIFGERCSGTHYLEHLLRDNLISTNIQWDFGWKHFFHSGPVEEADNCLFVIIYRDPFDWVRSIHKRSHFAAAELKRISFSRFIRKEWHCIWNEHSDITKSNPLYHTEMLFERDPVTGQRFANVIRLRSAKIRDWESLRRKAQHTYYLNYEALLESPQQHIEHLSETFKLRRAAGFNAVTSYKGLGKKPYEKKEYPAIGARDIAHIVTELDNELERCAGYNLAALAAYHQDKLGAHSWASLCDSTRDALRWRR